MTGDQLKLREAAKTPLSERYLIGQGGMLAAVCVSRIQTGPRGSCNDSTPGRGYRLAIF